jgi:hypothetical protein
MLEAILAIATVLGGVAALWFFWDRLALKERAYRAAGRLFHTRPPTLFAARQLGSTATVRFLVDWLENDQCRDGYYLGQFGLHANPKEERHFQTGREPLSVKPRLYLTGWPCFVLTRHHLAPQALETARRGISRLLQDSVVRVSEGALPGMAPADRPTLVSYRHTVRAVQILLALGKERSAISRTLGQILDPSGGWQNSDGGWAQCDIAFTDSDLWASAYAAALLFDLTRNGGFSSATSLPHSLAGTLAYLEAQWRQSKWAYGKLAAEQNAPQIFHEIARCLQMRAPVLRDEIVAWFKQWLTPAGTLSTTYYGRCKDLAAASASVRLAYAFYLAGDGSHVWRPLYAAAVLDFGQGNGANSADVAFLLDLTIALEHEKENRTAAA